MNTKNEMLQIILASKSPRRKELLSQAGLSFTIIPSAFDEDAVEIKDPAGYARHLAQNKALDIARQYPDSFVIGADTIVVVDGAVLNKPHDRDEARAMLARLQGRTHQVITGFCVASELAGHQHSEFCQTDVTFKPLSEAEMEWYISTDEPYDKAGGYAIQGLGSFMVAAVNGSYTNVVGLPVCEVLAHLHQIGVIRPVNENGGRWQTVTEINEEVKI